MSRKTETPQEIGRFIARAIICDGDAEEFSGCVSMVSRAIRDERRLIKRLAECLEAFYDSAERRDNPVMARTGRVLQEAANRGVKLINFLGV